MILLILVTSAGRLGVVKRPSIITKQSECFVMYTFIKSLNVVYISFVAISLLFVSGSTKPPPEFITATFSRDS